MAKLSNFKDTLSFSLKSQAEKDRVSLRLHNFAISGPILLFLFSSESLDNGLFAELLTFDHCLQEV